MEALTKNDIKRYRDDIKYHGVQGVVRVDTELLNNAKRQTHCIVK